METSVSGLGDDILMTIDFQRLLRNAVSSIVRRLPLILLGFAFSAAFFTYGYFVGTQHLFPYRQIKFAHAAFRGLNATMFGAADDNTNISSLTKVPLGEMEKRRITAFTSDLASEHLLVPTAINQFPGVCPGGRCAAVEFARDGRIVRAIPYRKSEFEKPRLTGLPYELSSTNDDALRVPWGIQQLPGGDIVMTFNMREDFPFGGGVARIRPNGTVVWFRSDYTHHWPNIIGPNEIALTSTELRDGSIYIPTGGQRGFDLTCPTRYYADLVRVIDFDGKTLEQFSALDALIHSPARGILAVVDNDQEACDPLHLNYATVVGPELAAHLPGVSPRDFLLSFFQLSALAIVSRDTHKLIRFYRGPFVHQHAVTPESGSKVLLFDNLGSDGLHTPSRLLEYDLATREARVVFPANGTEDDTYSDPRGSIVFSPDRKRVLVCFSLGGTCYEVRLADGKALMKFDNLGDARDVELLGPDRSRYAARYYVNGLYYVK